MSIQHSAPHPGEILFEFYLVPSKLTITDAAKALDISRPRLSDIVNKKAGISPVMALKLSKYFKTTPQLWLSMQNNYELSRVESKKWW